MNFPTTEQKTYFKNSRGYSGDLESKLKTLRVVILARVSSEEQAKKKFSIPEIQIPQSKELIKEMGWRFTKCYIDEGFDGNTFLKRPGLQKMLTEDIDTYDIVVVWSFDRLVRDDPYTEAKIYNILDGHKKQVTSVLQRVEIMDPEKYDPKSLNVATHRRFRSIQVSYDSLTRRERFMASKNRLVEMGKHIAEPPYGYKLIREIDPKDPRRTIGYKAPNKEEIPIAQRIFKERVFEGKSYRQIAFSLNDDQIRARKGGWWSGPRISQVLKNPLPAGLILWNRTQQRKYGDECIRKPIPEANWKIIPIDRKLEKYYRPIISEELFKKAQEMRKRNSQTNGRAVGSSNILTAIAKCPICKGPMVETGIYRVKKPPYKKGFYQCSQWSNKHLCSRKRYPSWPMKLRVIEKVRAFLDNPKEFREFLESNNTIEIKEKEGELKSRGEKLKRIQKRIESLNLKYLDNKIKEEYYSGLLDKLEKEEVKLKEAFLSLKEEVESFYQAREEKESLKALSKEIKGKFEKLTPKQMKLVVRAFIKEVFPDIKTIKGRGVKSDARDFEVLFVWKNTAIMERECASRKWR